MKKEELVDKRKHLQTLEKDLQTAYHELGKRTQEFTQKQTVKIDEIVDEIVLTKQYIQKAEEKSVHNK